MAFAAVLDGNKVLESSSLDDHPSFHNPYINTEADLNITYAQVLTFFIFTIFEIFMI